MTRKKGLTVAAACVAVLFVGIVIWLVARDDSPKKHLAATTVTTVTSTTAAAAPVMTTTSSVPLVSTTVKPVTDAKPYAPRTPVKCQRPGSPSGTLPGIDSSGSKKWVTVRELTGACDASSPTFHLRGIDTRLVWRSDAPSFAAFLLDKSGMDSTAGYADAECSGTCSDYQSLVDGPGDFVLSVQADGGPWEVEVQEYR